MYADNTPLQVPGVPLEPPVWDQGPEEPRQDDFHKRAVVCCRASIPRPHKFFCCCRSANELAGRSGFRLQLLVDEGERNFEARLSRDSGLFV